MLGHRTIALSSTLLVLSLAAAAPAATPLIAVRVDSKPAEPLAERGAIRDFDRAFVVRRTAGLPIADSPLPIAASRMAERTSAPDRGRSTDGLSCTEKFSHGSAPQPWADPAEFHFSSRLADDTLRTVGISDIDWGRLRD